MSQDVVRGQQWNVPALLHLPGCSRKSLGWGVKLFWKWMDSLEPIMVMLMATSTSRAAFMTSACSMIRKKGCVQSLPSTPPHARLLVCPSGGGGQIISAVTWDNGRVFPSAVSKGSSSLPQIHVWTSQRCVGIPANVLVDPIIHQKETLPKAEKKKKVVSSRITCPSKSPYSWCCLQSG